jgi:alpha/beta superfamily hydrolase
MSLTTMGLIRANTVLPSRRTRPDLLTSDGLHLVAELAVPADREPVATLVCLHPLPTHGGMMDSHVFAKAANRLPALAEVAVLRFNTRGTTSTAGTSDGAFDNAQGERHDVEAAVGWALAEGLPNVWLVGWSFGTDLAIKWGLLPGVTGAILLSPPLRFSEPTDLERWASDGRPLIAIVPEHDDYLKPDEARERFAVVPQAEVVGVDGAKHLWVGEKNVSRVLDEIVRRVAPQHSPLPTEHADAHTPYAPSYVAAHGAPQPD